MSPPIQLPRVSALRQQPNGQPPERTDDQFDRQAEATIFGIAQVRRENERLSTERNQLRDLNSDARATIAQLESTIREKDAEIARQKQMTDAWQHEAARLQAAIELAAGTLTQVVQPAGAEETTTA